VGSNASGVERRGGDALGARDGRGGQGGERASADGRIVGETFDVVDASRYRHCQLRSWHGRKANQPPRAVQTRDRVTGPV